MTYAVDFARGLFYWGSAEYDQVVLYSPWLDLGVIAVYFMVFIVIGTWMFVRNETNR